MKNQDTETMHAGAATANRPAANRPAATRPATTQPDCDCDCGCGCDPEDCPPGCPCA